MNINEILTRIGTSVGLTRPDLQKDNLPKEERGIALEDILDQLSPSNRRLIRELAYKLLSTQPPALAVLPNLTQCIDGWLLSLAVEGKSPKTVAFYSNYVKRLLEKYPSPTRDNIRNLLALRTFVVNVQSQGNAIYAYRSFFNYLIESNIITENPCATLKAPSRPLRERDIPSAREIAQLLGAPKITLRDCAAIRTLASCGLRIGELLGLQRADVDLENKRLRVIGKGNKQRSVPMTEATADCIQRHLVTAPSSSWLFPGHDPAKAYTSPALDDRFALLCKRAQMREIRPHQLRHYFASYLIRKGVNIKVVSQLLGHASVSVTVNVYWHLLDEKEREQAYRQAKPLQDVDEEMARNAVSQLSFDFDIKSED